MWIFLLFRPAFKPSLSSLFLFFFHLCHHFATFELLSAALLQNVTESNNRSARSCCSGTGNINCCPRWTWRSESPCARGGGGGSPPPGLKAWSVSAPLSQTDEFSWLGCTAVCCCRSECGYVTTVAPVVPVPLEGEEGINEVKRCAATVSTVNFSDPSRRPTEISELAARFVAFKYDATCFNSSETTETFKIIINPSIRD